MKIIIIVPSIGKKENNSYIRTWQMQPLTVAQLYSLIPKKHNVVLYDDRMENIPFDEDADLVLITVETYTARRSYNIADKFRKRGVKVLLGGYHISLLPKEAEEYADIILVGEAEDILPKILDDIDNNQYKKRYTSYKKNLNSIMPDRSIFKGKNYLPISLVESSRGCPYNCEFCSITAFHKQNYKMRPINNVIEDIKKCKNKNLFIVDDNIMVNVSRTKELLRKMIPLNIKWVGQGSIHIAQDIELLKLLKKSGCAMILIGFESLSEGNLKKMSKEWNLSFGEYNKLIKKIHKAGIGIYATFVFGYDEDNEKTFEKTYRFAMKNKFLFAAFNHLLPFPGTPVYNRLKNERNLIYDKWWISSEYKYGDIAFKPQLLTADKLKNLCIKYRKKYFSISSIIYRASNMHANLQNPIFSQIYFFQSLLARKEINQKTGLPLG